MKLLIALCFGIFCSMPVYTQNATIKEEVLNMKTYMFSEPDPVAHMSRIYPYFRFDKYAPNGKEKAWNMVVLENKYIKVYVCPAIGGKIWGAIEKSTGKEFLYFNDVVKFRDVAMRGAWSSGGLEYNFGDIGHIPTCSTPVDYSIKENEDGSVSCTVGALDLSSRTKWNVEISLGKDEAFFKTKASWFNTTSVPVTYYHWMNAAAKADGDLEFIYPGKKRIGHGGELGDWPIDTDRDISRYKNNDFGIYKSYHIINSYSNYFGGYWHEDDFGFGHYASYDDKPGKKIWIWGLSDQGMIWEDLLTDSNGQYIEYQAGKLFNQAANSSTQTPFKHREFMPYDSDIMHETWFPVMATGGMVAASPYGVLNVTRKGNRVNLRLSPLQPLNTDLVVKVDGQEVFGKTIDINTLQLLSETLTLEQDKDFVVELGDKLLVYNSDPESQHVNRPTKPTENFDWTSAYGLYIKGLEFEKQRRYMEARNTYEQSYAMDPNHIPTLNRLAQSHYRSNNLAKALEYAEKTLAIDTYSDLGNYLYGLVNSKLGNTNASKSGFSIASQSVAYRSACYNELGTLYLNERDYSESLKYTQKALAYNAFNIKALEKQALIYRKQNKKDEALKTISKIEVFDATSHFKNFEKYLLGQNDKTDFQQQITNELPAESYLELASTYLGYGLKDEALKVLALAPENAIVAIWKAYLDKSNEPQLLKHSLELSPKMVFPYREETGKILDHYIKENPHWKLKYYLGLQQWSSGNIYRAKSLFQQCENKPNNIPFYLAKIKLFDYDEDITVNALKRANKINTENWRLKLAWIRYYEKTNQTEQAKKLAWNTYKKHPDKAVIGMLYTKLLLKQKAYKKALTFLEGFEVLPFEGATEGRKIYHETCIELALEALKKQRYQQAVTYAEKAKKWPMNLGVGKHYDADERLDNYLMALAYEKLGNKETSEIYFNKIINHKTPKYLEESSKIYIQLKVLEKFGNKKMIEQLETRYRSKTKDNLFLKWAFLKFKNDPKEKKLSNEILDSNDEVQVYDTKYVDDEFELVQQVIKETNRLGLTKNK